MGYYIETTNGFPTGKADHFIEQHGATRITPHFIDPATGFVAVCVVRNAMFEAASVAYDRNEYDCFISPRDIRLKTWLKMSVEKVAELGPAHYAHLIGVDKTEQGPPSPHPTAEGAD